MSAEVQNRGISGPTKRTYVLQKFCLKKKKIRLSILVCEICECYSDTIFLVGMIPIEQRLNLCNMWHIRTEEGHRFTWLFDWILLQFLVAVEA